jgi:hypothetical protein
LLKKKLKTLEGKYKIEIWKKSDKRSDTTPEFSDSAV